MAARQLTFGLGGSRGLSMLWGMTAAGRCKAHGSRCAMAASVKFCVGLDRWRVDGCVELDSWGTDGCVDA
eukprot:366076-Chlamydomonas_euryale.AAC.1